jgi:hypothetical protein
MCLKSERKPRKPKREGTCTIFPKELEGTCTCLTKEREGTCICMKSDFVV